jgi:hypothetical protein
VLGEAGARIVVGRVLRGDEEPEVHEPARGPGPGSELAIECNGRGAPLVTGGAARAVRPGSELAIER